MTRTAPTARAVDAEARRRLDIDRLLDEQRDAIRAAAAGRDVLVVMPTGSGKSAIYQLAGEMRPGPTIVVSPLLALQHDQMTSIEETALSTARALNSLQPAAEFDATVDAYASGEIEFLFVAPEQLAKPEVLGTLARRAPSLFVVDEAHCISAWGHDFRPDYLRLADAARALGRPPVLALTATAAPPVRDEIVDRLGLEDHMAVAGGFDRPEIDLRVDTFHDAGAKRDALLSAVSHRDGAGIVYVATRRAAAQVAQALRDVGTSADHYHGSLARRERERVHEQFLSGELRVVVATNAFGMGIDKPDVRFVLHLDVPASLDAYYQEIGRAGRDGHDSEAILFYAPDDLRLQRFFRGGRVDGDVLARVLRATGDDRARSTTSVVRDARVSRTKGAAAVDALVRAGALARDRRGRVRTVRGTDRAAALAAAEEAEAARERVERSRIEMMRAYAESATCRRLVLLGYYGEAFEPPCGRCDNCRAGLVASAPADAPFAAGQAVEHREWGIGRVMIVEPERLVVLFDAHGYRTLALPLVVEAGIVTAAPAGAHR